MGLGGEGPGVARKGEEEAGGTLAEDGAADRTVKGERGEDDTGPRTERCRYSNLALAVAIRQTLAHTGLRTRPSRPGNRKRKQLHGK